MINLRKIKVLEKITQDLKSHNLLFESFNLIGVGFGSIIHLELIAPKGKSLYQEDTRFRLSIECSNSFYTKNKAIDILQSQNIKYIQYTTQFKGEGGVSWKDCWSITYDNEKELAERN